MAKKITEIAESLHEWELLKKLPKSLGSFKSCTRLQEFLSL